MIEHKTALEQQWLLEWVRSCPHTTVQSASIPLVSAGSEHAVYLDESSGEVVKLTLPGLYGDWYFLDGGRMTQAKATPGEYLVRIRMVAKQFGLSWTALGITDDARIVTRQPFVIGTPPSQAEADEFLFAAGFLAVRQQFWLWKAEEVNGLEAWIGDARADNFVRTAEGLVPIDLRMWNVITGSFGNYERRSH